jgi:hypothetical protein
MFRRKIVGYVSDIDKMLQNFDKTHPKSASQLAEMKKYEAIYAKRDKPAEDHKDKLL